MIRFSVLSLPPSRMKHQVLYTGLKGFLLLFCSVSRFFLGARCLFKTRSCVSDFSQHCDKLPDRSIICIYVQGFRGYSQSWAGNLWQENTMFCDPVTSHTGKRELRLEEGL